MHLSLCQISNQVINPEAGLKKTLSDEYYESLYTEKQKDGYYRPEHFWELPLWIGEATHALSDEHTVSLKIITDVRESLPFGPQVFCFSVLDVNKAIVADIIRRNADCVFLVGGYVDKTEFLSDLAGYSVTWLNSISELAAYAGTSYKYGVDWSLFDGYRTIPRLTMSYGCYNKCSFCTVPDNVEAVSYQAIHQQMKSFIGLEFKLVYLNDKTFGQHENSEYLWQCYDYIKSYNPDFRGFIVQTTCQEVLKRPAEFWSDNHIVVVELGIETFNDKLLKTFKKPQSEKTIAKAVDKLYIANVSVIANIVLGLPGETIQTYGKTLSFLHYFSFYAFNIYTLALYQGTELADVLSPALANGITARDSNELATTRSFWSAQEQRTFDHVSNLFYYLGIDKVTK